MLIDLHTFQHKHLSVQNYLFLCPAETIAQLLHLAVAVVMHGKYDWHLKRAHLLTCTFRHPVSLMSPEHAVAMYLLAMTVLPVPSGPTNMTE